MSASSNISRAAFMLLASVKDSISSTLAEARRSGRIQIDEKELSKVIDLINQTADAAYHRAHETFSKAVNAALDSESKKK